MRCAMRGKLVTRALYDAAFIHRQIIMELSCKNIDLIMADVLYREDEVPDGVPPADAIVAESLMNKFAFNPIRLESHRQDVKDMLSELPDAFFEGKGGGWSFLNLPFTKDDRQWGEQYNADALLALGVGLGIMWAQMPREMWKIFPGGVPYIGINLDGHTPIDWSVVEP